MKKQIVAAMIAALVVAGTASAVSYHIVKSDKTLTKRLVVGTTDSDPGVDNATIGGTLAVTGTSTFTGAITATGGVTGSVTGTQLGPVPTTQVIGAAGTIAADACGGVKRVSSAAAVTTSTTNTFTAPAAANAGCVLNVCNENASDAITLDNNALFQSAAAGDVVLGALDCVQVASSGASGKWYQISALQAN